MEVITMKTASGGAATFDLLVFVGRFQPLHFGHIAVIREALKSARHVLVLVGSANAARSARNPFSYEERQRMISDAVAEMDAFDEHGVKPAARVIIKPLDDHVYADDAWTAEVQATVYETIAEDLPAGTGSNVGLIGHNKDNSSYYLRIFPKFGSVDVEGVRSSRDELLSSTRIRERAFAHVLDGSSDQLSPFGEMADAMPPSVRGHLDRIWRTAPFARIVEEVEHVRTYRAQWANTPYPVTFTTVDALVTCNGHVLMVVRGEMPGKGLFALPGGFIRPEETLFDACVRELREETTIDVPPRVLVRSCVNKNAARVFDDPFRSVRGRTITNVFRFDLAEPQLPKIKGADDAAEATWIPVGSITPRACFEDHGHIIRSMLGTA
ncbi:MAG: bifunctional nicotinamide-nucleotide adenylyltransferase/Nudix hydroxylase [Candidatus Eremiobacteraeota bacterium]|nr:bifunctional nicotinamide-nucleotide adenylyltransferase/Nudix hydroxylase [Candidatus Eremiobacteraeota bacterium]